MTFHQWFATKEWWSSSAEDTFSEAWTSMAEAGMDSAIIIYILDAIISTMRNEYGD